MTEHVEQLVLQVESSADWRAGKADQYPDDKRNVRSSQALFKLAENLKKLPPDDEQLMNYEAVIDRAVELASGDNLLFELSQIHSRYIGRYGFDYPQDGNVTDFLEGLIEECQSAVEEVEKEIAKEQDKASYEAAKEEADESVKEAAHEAAREAADEAAKEAAQEAYDEAYRETYDEVYKEVYRETLMKVLNER